MIEVWENDEVVRCVNTERPLTHSLDLGEEGLAVQATRTCSVTGCESQQHAKGYCKLHYERVKRLGTPHIREMPSGCAIENCAGSHHSRGFCRNHYRRLARHGDPMGGMHYSPGAACSIEDCDKPAKGRGWCYMHWTRWRNNGDPMVTRIGGAASPGSQNIKWQGEEIGYGTAHDRVRKARGSARSHPCADCGLRADNWSYDHLDPDERIQPDDPKKMPYSTKIEHYQPRCHACHWKLDHPGGRRSHS